MLIKLMLDLWVAFANSIVYMDKQKAELVRKGYEEKKKSKDGKKIGSK